MKTIFGPAGVPLNCKTNLDGLEHSASVGLKAYELEFVRGVRMNDLLMSTVKKTADRLKVKLSCHGPYWTNLCNPDKFETNNRNLLQSIKAAINTGATIVVIHPGFYGPFNPEQAFNECLRTLKRVKIDADKKGYKDYRVGLETVGKRTQFGSLKEIIGLCKELNFCRPVIDFAHIHARGNGCLKTEKDFQEIFDLIEEELGNDYLKDLHCHFAEIEYTEKGERWHLAVGSKWQPDFRKLARIIADNDYQLRIISESPLLDQDALKMKSILERTYKKQ